MTTKREDVLFQVGEVRYKKGDGTLYIMNERLAWMAENRDTVAVSHKFQDIKMQKISPEGKPKVQLQVVLHDGNSSTFHFVNRNGQAAQIQDRDKIKELLQKLLPNFKRKVDKELEEKNRILKENPNLLQLYKDLVMTQVLTSDEFWATYAQRFLQNRNSKKQDIGVSGAFLADIKPQTDGCNGLKYNLTSDVIHSIFKTYPAVRRKHQENVPSKMSESEFWTKFFQSHYFHRDRITAGTKDIFTECGKIDDQTLKAAAQQCAGDPLLDLSQFEDYTLEEGFGGTLSEKEGVNSGNIVHQSMIKRFNQHSIMVLKTCADVTNSQQQQQVSTKNSTDVNTNNYNNCKNSSMSSINSINSIHSSKHQNSTVDEETRTIKKRVLEKISYDDLGILQIDSDQSKSVNDQQQQKFKLNLSKIERYLYGPVAVTNSEITSDGLKDLNSVQYQLLQDCKTLWNQRTPYKSLVSATSAVNALQELSPGGALMRGFQEQSSAQLVPKTLEKELQNLYLSLNELLRHYWPCFPPTTPEMEAKAIKMHEALQRFKLTKLVPFEEKSMRELAPLSASLTQHLSRLFQSATRKYATWQERKLRQHHR